jgi:hypothetical protein
LTLVIILWQPEDAENSHGVPTDRFDAAVTANGLMLSFLLSVFLAKTFSYLGELFVEVSFQDVYKETFVDATIHKFSSYINDLENTSSKSLSSKRSKPSPRESQNDRLLF